MTSLMSLFSRNNNTSTLIILMVLILLSSCDAHQNLVNRRTRLRGTSNSGGIGRHDDDSLQQEHHGPQNDEGNLVPQQRQLNIFSDVWHDTSDAEKAVIGGGSVVGTAGGVLSAFGLKAAYNKLTSAEGGDGGDDAAKKEEQYADEGKNGDDEEAAEGGEGATSWLDGLKDIEDEAAVNGNDMDGIVSDMAKEAAGAGEDDDVSSSSLLTGEDGEMLADEGEGLVGDLAE